MFETQLLVKELWGRKPSLVTQLLVKELWGRKPSLVKELWGRSPSLVTELRDSTFGEGCSRLNFW
jgi:hypothetical protein